MRLNICFFLFFVPMLCWADLSSDYEILRGDVNKIEKDILSASIAESKLGMRDAVPLRYIGNSLSVVDAYLVGMQGMVNLRGAMAKGCLEKKQATIFALHYAYVADSIAIEEDSIRRYGDDVSSKNYSLVSAALGIMSKLRERLFLWGKVESVCAQR